MWMRFSIISTVGAALLLFACKGGSSSDSPPSPGASSSSAATTSDVALNGSGASFPQPLYAKWIDTYQAQEKKIKINYQSVGSGAGIKNVTDKTVDFGASDAPMSDEQLAKASPPIVHIPMTLGAVVITYNVPGVPDHLKLSADVAAGIFTGTITTWNDPKVAALNPDVKLPAQKIGVVYRSDGSGTTAIFTDYLAKASPLFKEKVGNGTSVKWPVGNGANKNDGVAAQIKQTPGSVGYVELAFALQTKLPVALLKNKSGKFVEPTLEAITAAAATANLPEDLRVSITDADGDAAYPIAAFTYILVHEDNPDAAKAQALGSFLWWGIHEGQSLGPALHYAPLPAAVVAKAEARLKLLKGAGKPLSYK